MKRTPWIVGGMLAALLSGCGNSDVDQIPASSGQTEQGDSVALEEVTAFTRDFSFALSVDAKVASSAGVRLDEDNLFEFRSTVADGDLVIRGQSIGELLLKDALRKELLGESASSDSAKFRLQALDSREGTVESPITGVFRAKDKVVESQGLEVQANLTPIQSLRLKSVEFSADTSLETTSGVQTFTCESIWVSTASANQLILDELVPVDEAVTVHCRLPDNIETVPGVEATLSMKSQVIEKATVVPAISVQYVQSLQEFAVCVAEDGEPALVPVIVGPTDGVVRVVYSGVTDGTVLSDGC